VVEQGGELRPLIDERHHAGSLGMVVDQPTIGEYRLKLLGDPLDFVCQQTRQYEEPKCLEEVHLLRRKLFHAAL